MITVYWLGSTYDNYKYYSLKGSSSEIGNSDIILG